MSPTNPETELQELLQRGPETREAAAEALSSTPEDPIPRLASLGGLASAQAIAEGMRPQPTIRELRDRLKSLGRVRKLGGGFYALAEHPAPSLQDWLDEWMGDRRLPESQVLDGIESAWAHGHRPSILAWIQQDPGPVRASQGEVWIFRSRRRRS